MSLKNVKKGIIKKPLAICVYGVEKVGKSKFASQATKPIFLGGEDIDELDADAFPKCNNFQEFLASLDALIKEKHEYKTVVIDTIDSIESLLHEQILSKDKHDIMAKACGGYGAAYTKAAQEMTEVRRKLEILRNEKKMNIIILAHAQKINVIDPVHNLTYISYEMRLDKRAVCIFKDWVQAILFADFKSYKTEKNGEEYLMGKGERQLLTEKRAGHEGGNRFGLPYTMPLEWGEFIKHVTNFYKGESK